MSLVILGYSVPNGVVSLSAFVLSVVGSLALAHMNGWGGSLPWGTYSSIDGFLCLDFRAVGAFWLHF
jgi:hypothetical protein